MRTVLSFAGAFLVGALVAGCPTAEIPPEPVDAGLVLPADEERAILLPDGGSCPTDQKVCGETCIAKVACCSDGDCQLPEVCVAGSCGTVCGAPLYQCDPIFLPDGGYDTYYEPEVAGDLLLSMQLVPHPGGYACYTGPCFHAKVGQRVIFRFNAEGMAPTFEKSCGSKAPAFEVDGGQELHVTFTEAGEYGFFCRMGQGAEQFGVGVQVIP